VRIGGRTVIHSGVRLDPGCRIGADVTIYSNAVLYEGTVVGERTMIHAGAVLGAYGFGYDSTSRGHRLCPQLGNVEIGCDVEIGACTTIDRGTFGPTRIGDGTKIDNLVMIAHNCQIGRHNMLCAQVGLAGSCVTGDFVVMAGQVGVRDHLRIGDQATIGAKSGVMGHVKPKTTVVGLPATDIREQMNRQASWARMPDLREQVQKQEQVIRELLERIEQLENARPKLYEPDESPADEAARRAA
jgi:UDP-3-O-[3-hydroxymyristoyl] glucosamine N-acyltransferase